MTSRRPSGNPPAQGDLDRAFAEATRADLRRDGERLFSVYAPRLTGLGEALRLDAGPAPHPRFTDPPGSVEVRIERTGEPLGTLLIHSDLSIRWTDWRESARVQHPRQLAEWLAGLGIEEPLAALGRDQAATRAAAVEGAPEELEPHLDGLTVSASVDVFEAAFGVLARARGERGAVWSICEWLGSLDGEGAEVGRRLLETHGTSEVIALAEQGVPALARGGLARFLATTIKSRVWRLQERLPEPVREELLEAPTVAGEDRARLEHALGGEEPAPAGSALVAAARSGRLRRACHDGARILAIDGTDLVCFDRGERVPLTKVFDPTTPIAVRGDAVWMRRKRGGGPCSVPIEGGEARSRSAPRLGLAARRLESTRRSVARARDELLARAAHLDASLLTLDLDEDACDAYAAFGGTLPRPQRGLWACDVQAGKLHHVPEGGAPVTVSLDGRPLWIGADDDASGALLILERNDEFAVVSADRGASLRAVATLRIAGRPRRAFRMGGVVHLVHAAPLGDVVLALGE